MISRFGTTYNAFKAMQKMLESTKSKDPVVLMPPDNYIRAMKVDGDVAMPEPAVFYYFTGIRSVFANSPQRELADWVLVAENHRLWIRKIQSKKQRDSLVLQFKKYTN